MIFKKDSLVFGLILGMLAPVVGMLLLKRYKFGVFSYKETFQYVYYQPGHQLLSAGLTVSLLLNALLFTIYINTNRDHTGKGIFISTVLYGITILLLKTFG